ncbi:hypothetical protein BJV82DRAFT_675695 [Fennellomyces sp. T-0311]|nr:hypothetical protein BJV82DRAFT_675695 [Fennellomyces sp. T-0311]
MDDYRHTYSGNHKSRRFFAETSLKDWNFEKFQEYLTKSLRKLPEKSNMHASFQMCLAHIMDDPAVPEYVKKKAKSLLKKKNQNDTQPQQSNTYNVFQGDSSFAFVNFDNQGDNSFNGVQTKRTLDTTTTTDPNPEESVFCKRNIDPPTTPQSPESPRKSRKRTYSVDYLRGKGCHTVTRTNDADQWDVLGHDKALVTIQQQLALNCIFYIHDSSQIEYGIEKTIWKCAVEECQLLYGTKELPDSVTSKLRHLSKKAKKNYTELDDAVTDWNDVTYAGYKDEIRKIKSTFRELIPLYKPESSVRNAAHESTFSLSTVHPIILPFMEEDYHLSRYGTDGEVVGSKARRDNNSNCSRSSAGQIKSPHCVKDGKRPDFLKVANEMKDAIDTMVRDGIDDFDISVLCLLVAGFKCSLMAMDLMYQGIYRLSLVNTFYIPRAHDDFAVLEEAFETLVAMDKMIQINAMKCLQFALKKEPKTIRGDYIVDSYDTPLRYMD